MSNFEELILSVTSRVTHEPDFTFSQTNGEFANYLRREFASETEGPLNLTGVELDQDGDVRARVERATCYFSASTVTVAGWLTSAKKLLEVSDLSRLGEIVEVLCSKRSQFRHQEYDVRLFVWVRAVSESDLEAILSRLCSAALAGMVAGNISPHFNRGRIQMEYQKDKFNDSVELEASKDGVELRYVRAGRPKDFDSYRGFLGSADLRGLVEDMRPFVDMFKTSQLRPFGTKG
jgi:hypothetical protein